MARALAQTRSFAFDGFEAARSVIVLACALARIAAGQALPF